MQQHSSPPSPPSIHLRDKYQVLRSIYRRTMYDHRRHYFLAFRLAKALSLRMRPLRFLSFSSVDPLLMGFLTLDRSFVTTLTPPALRAFLAFFLAKRRATRSVLDALTFLRSSFDSVAILSPREGSPLGITIGSGFGRLPLPFFSVDDDDVLDLFGSTLHRCTRSFLLANLSLPSSMDNISSTHSRSYIVEGQL